MAPYGIRLALSLKVTHSGHMSSHMTINTNTVKHMITTDVIPLSVYNMVIIEEVHWAKIPSSSKDDVISMFHSSGRGRGGRKSEVHSSSL